MPKREVILPPPVDAFKSARARGIKTIRLSIFQPRHGGMKEVVITLEDLIAFASLARSKACSVENAAADFGNVDQALWNQTYLNSSPNAEDCAFCKAMATCPSYNGAVQGAIGDDFQAIVEAGAVRLVPGALPAVDLSAAMKATWLIEDWVKAVRGEVERRLLAGSAVDGFGLELGRQGPRRWTNEEDVKFLLKKMRLTVEDAYNLKLKSPTQIEAFSPQKPKKGQEPVKPLIGPRQWKQMQAYVVRSDPSPSVKRAVDIKNPYTPAAPSGDAFSPIEDDGDLF